MVQIEKIKLNIENKQLMKEFYSNTLKLSLVDEKQDQLSYAMAEGLSPSIILNVVKNPLKRKENTLYHYALLLPKRADLGDFLAHLVTTGYGSIDGGADHLVSEAIYLRDPEENTIEVYADRDADSWQWIDGQVKMDTLQLKADELLANAKSWSGFPKETIIGHLHFYGSNLDEADIFFTSLLRQDKVSMLGEAANFYSYDQYHHHFALNVWQGVSNPNRLDSSLGMSQWQMKVDHGLFEKIHQRLVELSYPFKAIDEALEFADPVGSMARIVR